MDYLNIDNVPKQPDHLNVDAAKSDLMSLSEDQDVFYDAESGDEKDTETPSPESQPAEKEETKVNGYLDQAVSTVNYFVHQAAKATPYLAATCLPYNYASTPVSASFDNVNVTNLFVANQCKISSMF